MNVIVFGKGFGTPRQVNLTGFTAGMSIAVVAGLIVAAGFAAGSWHSSRTGSGVSTDELQGLTGELQEQRDSIEGIRQENEDTLDALSIRIAQMNARMIRLDALGRRLTDMADIDDGEFDFDSAPAMGGPEEPMAAGSNVAIAEMLDSMNMLGAQLNNREAQLDVLEGVLMNQKLKERVYPQGRPVPAGCRRTLANEPILLRANPRITPVSISLARWAPRFRRLLTAW